MKLWVEGAGSSSEIELGQTFIRSNSPQSSYLTRYPDDFNGIIKFRGTVRHFSRQVAGK